MFYILIHYPSLLQYVAFEDFRDDFHLSNFQPDDFSIHLAFDDLSKETLEVNKEGKILTSRTIPGLDREPEIKKNQGLTNLDLMGTVLPFTIADTICDLDYHYSAMDENIQAFGQTGADNVEAFKNKWLAGTDFQI